MLMADEVALNFYELFPDCVHILDDLYDYGLEIGLNDGVVDDFIARSYAANVCMYEWLKSRRQGLTGLHRLQVYILDKVRSDLEDLACEYHGVVDEERRC